MISPTSRSVDRKVHYLAIRDDEAEIGLDAVKVLRILRSDEWTGMPPFNIAALLRGREGPREERILVVNSRDGELALTTGQPMRMRAVSPSKVLTLPALVWPHRSSAVLFEGIGFEPDGLPLLVLDLDATMNFVKSVRGVGVRGRIS